jgi:hypothetical protein
MLTISIKNIIIVRGGVLRLLETPTCNFNTGSGALE